jgi:hypothetical protein
VESTRWRGICSFIARQRAGDQPPILQQEKARGIRIMRLSHLSCRSCWLHEAKLVEGRVQYPGRSSHQRSVKPGVVGSGMARQLFRSRDRKKTTCRNSTHSIDIRKMARSSPPGSSQSGHPTFRAAGHVAFEEEVHRDLDIG